MSKPGDCWQVVGLALGKPWKKRPEGAEEMGSILIAAVGLQMLVYAIVVLCAVGQMPVWMALLVFVFLEIFIIGGMVDEPMRRSTWWQSYWRRFADNLAGKSVAAVLFFVLCAVVLPLVRNGYDRESCREARGREWRIA